MVLFDAEMERPCCTRCGAVTERADVIETATRRFKTGHPWANSPNGVLYVGRLLRLIIACQAGTWHDSPVTTAPVLPRNWGRFFGRMASKTEFNGIGGLRTYT
jgi:hypothetical protein